MKIKLFALCMLLLGASFFACKKEVSPHRSTTIQTDQELIREVSQLAALHNQGLAFIYKGLKADQQTSAGQASGKTSDVRPPWDPGPIDPTLPPPGGLIIDYNYQFMRDQLNINIDSVYSVNPDILYDSIDVKLQLWDHNQYWVSDFIKYMLEYNISTTLADALNDFQLVVENTSDTALIRSQGDAIIDNNISLLPDTIEKVLLIAAVKTGTNSAAYWQENAADWQTLADAYDGTYAKTTSGGDDLKDAVFDDLVGAAAGVVRGAIVGGTGGTLVVPGVGTVTGAAACGMLGMVGGAVANSATSFFWSKFKKWVDWYVLPKPENVDISYIHDNVVITLPVDERIH